MGGMIRPRSRWTFCAVLGACASVGLAGAGAAAATTKYTITDLGSLGFGVSVGAGINASGQITGESYLATTVPAHGCPPRVKHCVTHPEHPFLDSSGTMTDLGTLGGNFAVGFAINRSGEVAGYSTTASGNYQAFVDQNGQMTGLGSLVTGGSSQAYAINDSGAVAGQASVSNGGPHAFLNIGGKMTDLGLLPGEGGTFTTASGINNSNQVAGSGDNAASEERAFRYSNGKMTDLGAYNIDTVAEAINDSGAIVGQTYGQNSDGSTFNHAFIYTAGHFQDLNSLIPAGSGFDLTNAPAINDNDQIVAEAYDTTTGQNQTVILNPS